MRLEHAAPARGHDHAPVPARCLQVGVERVFGAVDGEQAVHQVALDLRQAVFGGQQTLHFLLYAVPAEAGAEQHRQEHGRRGEEHRVVGDEVAQLVEGRPQPLAHRLPQHPRARAEKACGRRASAIACAPSSSSSSSSSSGVPSINVRFLRVSAMNDVPTKSLYGAVKCW